MPIGPNSVRWVVSTVRFISRSVRTDIKVMRTDLEVDRTVETTHRTEFGLGIGHPPLSLCHRIWTNWLLLTTISLSLDYVDYESRVGR